MGVSGREAGRLVGRDEKAIRLAASAGKITRLPDGTYDRDEVISVWGVAADRDAEDQEEDDLNAEKTHSAEPVDPHAAVSRVQEILGEGGSPSLDKARTAEAIVRVWLKDIQVKRLNRELVPLVKVQAHGHRIAIEWRRAMQNIPPRHAEIMAAELGCDPALLEKLMSEVIAKELDAIATPLVTDE